MPKVHHSVLDKTFPTAVNYEDDPQWRKKPLTPAQLLVHDIRLETWRRHGGPLLECNERAASSLVPETAANTPSASYVRATEAAKTPIEQQKFTKLEEDYGWIRHLRLLKHQIDPHADDDSAKCRWLHCSSMFPDYLRAFLWALTDDQTTISESLRMLDHAIQRQTRFSKHGKNFSPFFQPLSPSSGSVEDKIYPMLVSVPFLDWTVLGTTPPLRFQVDRREGFHSSRSSAHMLRSILQYFYRLEDTVDREGSQVFAKHKPWQTNRELDLKVRQWYGHYPTSLNVDELWILAVDAEHIVTFSSNQTWKSRWPPLQLTSRISDVSFRGLRNAFYTSENGPPYTAGDDQEYTALTHMLACLGGAVGMMHRNFWPDMVLCLTDRYAGYLSQLQYRLHRSPSTKLVMDLIACQEELNIVIQITQQQVDMIGELPSVLEAKAANSSPAATSPVSQRPVSSGRHHYGDFDVRPAPRHRATYRQLSSSQLIDPISQLLDNLQRELIDLQDLRDNTDRLVTRTIQLVNIRLEDHGKAILVFTVVTIIFLPLNFVSSFFGMNVADIRGMAQNQWLFWAVALCVTAAVVASSLFLAFSGGDILEKISMWRDARRERQVSTTTVLRQSLTGGAEQTFRVYGMDRDDRYG